MKCELCHHPESFVIRTEQVKDATIRRRRECCRCGHRWNTYESNENAAAELARIKSALAPVAELIR